MDNVYSKLVDRNIGILTEEQQKKLEKTCVAVFGLGGHGGVASQLLARSGIGKLKIVDIEKFETSNLNRQVYCYMSTIDKEKVDVAEHFLKDINPEIEIESFHTTNGETINKMLDGTTVALLCIDDVVPSIHVARACRERGIPMIETGAMPFQNLRVYTKDTITFEEFHDFPTQRIKTEDLYDLDENIRGQIKRKLVMAFSDIKGIQNFYNSEAIEKMKKGVFPTFAPMVWLQATMIALEAVKIILNWGKISLVPKYALYDPIQYEIPTRSAVKRTLINLFDHFIRKNKEKIILLIYSLFLPSF